VRGLCLEFEPDGSLSGERLDLVVGMNAERACFRLECLARRQRIGVTGAADLERRPERGDGGLLRWARDLRNEDRGRMTELAGGKGDGRAVVAARGCGHARFGHRPRHEVRERAARLEAAGMLQQFELQRKRSPIEAKVRKIDIEHRCATDMRPDRMVGRSDLFARYARIHFAVPRSSAQAETCHSRPALASGPGRSQPSVKS
jgi:hypothetical protein